MSKFVVMLRVKDGIGFVPVWLACFERLADEIVVLDNGSTDGTYEALLAHPRVVRIVRTEGYNEGRDKNLMYDAVRERKPDWCLWIDIDEVFEPSVTRRKLDRMMKTRLVKRYAFRRFHFIDDEHFAGSPFRLNYSAGHDRIMWKESPSGYFENLLIDSPNVKGIGGLKLPTHLRLKHLGYISKDLVDRKAALYRSIIPDKESIFQEMYMRDEKKIRWIDNPRDPKVLLLTARMDLMLARQYAVKAVRLGTQALKKLFRRGAGNPTTMALANKTNNQS